MSSWAARAKVHFSQIPPERTPKTPETPLLGVLGVGIGRSCEIAEGVLGVLGVPTQPLCEKQHIDSAAANDPRPDPDRWAWPYSEAMTGNEIDTFTARLHHFTRRGLTGVDAEKLSDKLVMRDRETDDRRLCLECIHLNRSSGWRCAQWQRAGLGGAGIPAGLVLQLQRCDSFKDSIPQRTTP